MLRTKRVYSNYNGTKPNLGVLCSQLNAAVESSLAAFRLDVHEGEASFHGTFHEHFLDHKLRRILRQHGFSSPAEVLRHAEHRMSPHAVYKFVAVLLPFPEEN